MTNCHIPASDLPQAARMLLSKSFSVDTIWRQVTLLIFEDDLHVKTPFKRSSNFYAAILGEMQSHLGENRTIVWDEDGKSKTGSILTSRNGRVELVMTADCTLSVLFDDRMLWHTKSACETESGETKSGETKSGETKSGKDSHLSAISPLFTALKIETMLVFDAFRLSSNFFSFPKT